VKTFFLSSLAIILLVTGCKKISPGIASTVSGTVMDNNRGVPIMNATVTLRQEKYKLFGGATTVGNPITTTSGPDGKYSITFTSGGPGDDFELSLSVDSNYLNENNPQKIPAEKDTVVNFNAWQLAILKAHIIVKNNPAPPLTVFCDDFAGVGIWGTNNDTVVTLKVIPNRPNGLQFLIKVPSNQYDSSLITDFTLSGFSTTYYQTFTVNPSTFPVL